MQKCKCPSCGAELMFRDDREFAFCEYCGSKLLLDDYRETHRYIDEAELEKARAYREVETRKIELANRRLDRRERQEKECAKKRAAHAPIYKKIMCVTFVICIVFIIARAIGIGDDKDMTALSMITGSITCLAGCLYLGSFL